MKSYILDMDGVFICGGSLIKGSEDFIVRLKESGAKFILLTNNPKYTQRDLQHRLHVQGLDVPAENIYTSAMATASFIAAQTPGASVFAIGETGLQVALHNAGLVITETDPDYVVVGETETFDYEKFALAARLIKAGSLFLATNPDVIGPSEKGFVPACGAIVALIREATGVMPYFIGKPNPLMISSALKYLDSSPSEAIVVGDRMDTDINSGIESGIETILVLTGVTKREDIKKFPYRPTRVVDIVSDIEIE